MRHFPLNIDKLLEQLFKYSPREITFFNFSSDEGELAIPRQYLFSNLIFETLN